MGLFSKDIQTMDDLFLHTLQDIYYAENRIVKSLPDMIDNAGNEELKRGLTAHLRETEAHVQRLEQVFRRRRDEHVIDSRFAELLRGGEPAEPRTHDDHIGGFDSRIHVLHDSLLLS